MSHSINPYESPQESGPLPRRGVGNAPLIYFRLLWIATGACAVFLYCAYCWEWADWHDRSAYIIPFNSCIFLSSVVHSLTRNALYMVLAMWPVSVVYWWCRSRA